MKSKTPLRSYKKWLLEIKSNIQQSRLQTALKVNSDMLILYWYIGNQLSEKIDKEGWGTKVIAQLADDLQTAFPDMRGFSYRNLYYMKKFAEAYPDLLIVQQAVAQLRKNRKPIIEKGKNEFVQQAVAQMNDAAIRQKPATQITQQVVAQFGNEKYFLSNSLLVSIPWGHHITLLDKINNNEERLWYINKTIENDWSRAVLQYQVQTDLYQRQHKVKKASNFHRTLPKVQADLANQILKDPYIFSFPQMGEFITERELEKHLVEHIRDFILELGAGFAFVGNQVRFKVGRKSYASDLLFYHLYLRSFVVIDLKMNEFEMEHAGKMNGYLNMVNKQMRQQEDNPSIGIILCAEKDNVEVDFALTNINQPIGVSEYNFSKTLPRKLQNQLPSAKQLQQEVTRFLKQASAKRK